MTDGRDTTIRLRGGIDVWALSLNSKKNFPIIHSICRTAVNYGSSELVSRVEYRSRMWSTNLSTSARKTTLDSDQFSN